MSEEIKKTEREECEGVVCSNSICEDGETAENFRRLAKTSADDSPVRREREFGGGERIPNILAANFFRFPLFSGLPNNPRVLPANISVRASRVRSFVRA